MEISTIIPHIEALIFASDKPLMAEDIQELINKALGFMEERATLDQIEQALAGIVEKYSSEFYPFEVRQSGGGYQFLTKPAFHETIATLNGERYLKRLSASALETLSIIAYKQPVTKSEVELVRGVNCDYAMQKLLEKELIVITGRRENAPGQPLVYETSKTFMDYFGINSKDQLPKLNEVAEESTLPTLVSAGEIIDEALDRIIEDNAGENAPVPEGVSNEIMIDDGEEVPRNEAEIEEDSEGNAIIADDGEPVPENPEEEADALRSLPGNDEADKTADRNTETNEPEKPL